MKKFFIKHYVWMIVLFVAAVYPPRAFFSLHTDDYLIRSNVLGDHPDFYYADNNDFLYRVINTFYFFGNNEGKTIQLKNYGALPWWSEDDAMMSMFRPLSGLTHYLDFKLLHENKFLIQIHSLFWFLSLALAIVWFYRLLGYSAPIIILASLIFLVDFNHLFNFYWLAARNSFIALFFGVACLAFHHVWRTENKIKFCMLSILCLLLSLLSAEAGIAIFAYLFSYALFMDKDDFKIKILTLLPYLILIVGWRIFYHLNNYGSQDISLYLDPLRSPVEFFYSLSKSMLFIATSVITATGSLVPGADSTLEMQYLMVGVVFILLSIYLLKIELISDNRIQFLALGCVLSIIPFCALSSFTSRSGLFAYFGFSFLIAVVTYRLWLENDYKLLKKSFVLFILLGHLFLPLGFSVFVSIAPMNNQRVNQDMSLEFGYPGDSKHHTVYLNHPSEVNAMFMPYMWKSFDVDAPLSLIRLVPGLNSFTLYRKSENEFLLKSDYHFVLNQNGVLFDEQDRCSKSGLQFTLRKATGFTANNQKQYHVGDIYRLQNFSVKVLSIKQGLPSELQVVISPHIDITDLDVRLWNWNSMNFEALKMPELESELRVLNHCDSLKAEV